LDKIIRPWAPTPRTNFLTRNFIGNKVVVRVFRRVDWLSSISGSTVMAKKGQEIREIPRNPLGIIYKISNEDILRLPSPQ